MTGCGGGPGVVRGPDQPSGPGSAASASIPAGGIGLRELGFSNGPPAFSLPADVATTLAADTGQQVTVIIAAPPWSQVADYLRRTLPRTGFTITGQGADGLTFTGYGWNGSATTSTDGSAVTLQRQT